jgi:CRP-like cAMP-binding protein
MILLEELAELDFLRGLSPPHLLQIAGMAQLKEVLPGAVLFREGRPAGQIYLVLQGEVTLEMHLPGQGDVAVQTVGPGELLGWSPVLRTGPMTATGRTLTLCRLAVLDARQLLDTFEHDPKLGLEFLRRLAVAVARRLEAARRQLRGAYPHVLHALALEEGGIG